MSERELLLGQIDGFVRGIHTGQTVERALGNPVSPRLLESPGLFLLEEETVGLVSAKHGQVKCLHTGPRGQKKLQG